MNTSDARDLFSDSPDDGWRPLSVQALAEDLRSTHPQITVLRFHAKGGMGAIYEGRLQDEKGSTLSVAIKVLRPDAADDADYLRRFRREQDILATLGAHPHIVRHRLHGTTSEGYPFLVMDWVQGTSLTEFTERGSTTDRRELLQIADDICSAVQHAHEHDILHRDLKPQNIIVTEKGRAVVLDFGIARSLKPGNTLTQPGDSPGTLGYIAPEVRNGEKPDARADIYSLGIILYQLLMKRLPEAFAARPSEQSLDPRFDEIVMKAANPEREKRYQTAADFASVLAELPERIATDAAPIDTQIKTDFASLTKEHQDLLRGTYREHGDPSRIRIELYDGGRITIEGFDFSLRSTVDDLVFVLGEYSKAPIRVRAWEHPENSTSDKFWGVKWPERVRLYTWDRLGLSCIVREQVIRDIFVWVPSSDVFSLPHGKLAGIELAIQNRPACHFFGSIGIEGNILVGPIQMTDVRAIAHCSFNLHAETIFWETYDDKHCANFDEYMHSEGVGLGCVRRTFSRHPAPDVYHGTTLSSKVDFSAHPWLFEAYGKGSSQDNASILMLRLFAYRQDATLISSRLLELASHQLLDLERPLIGILAGRPISENKDVSFVTEDRDPLAVLLTSNRLLAWNSDTKQFDAWNLRDRPVIQWQPWCCPEDWHSRMAKEFIAGWSIPLQAGLGIAGLFLALFLFGWAFSAADSHSVWDQSLKKNGFIVSLLSLGGLGLCFGIGLYLLSALLVVTGTLLRSMGVGRPTSLVIKTAVRSQRYGCIPHGRGIGDTSLFEYWLDLLTSHTVKFAPIPLSGSAEPKSSSAQSGALASCRACHKKVAFTARRCPSCGAINPANTRSVGFREVNCPTCSAVFSRFADRCPECKHPNNWMRYQAFAALALTAGSAWLIYQNWRAEEVSLYWFTLRAGGAWLIGLLGLRLIFGR